MSKKSKLCDHWRDSQNIKAGIESVVRLYVTRARMASRDAAAALRQDRERSSESAFHNYLRYRAERQNWIHAAKQLLCYTTAGVAHFDSEARRCAVITGGGK